MPGLTPAAAAAASSSLPLSLQPSSAGPSFGPRIHRPSINGCDHQDGVPTDVSAATLLLDPPSLSAIHRSVSSILADSDLRQRDLGILARLLDKTAQLNHAYDDDDIYDNDSSGKGNALTGSARNAKANGDLRKKSSNNALSVTATSSTGARGTKRARLDSESSLSPAESTSSSLETTISSHVTSSTTSKTAPHPSLHHPNAEERGLIHATSEETVGKASVSKAAAKADNIKLPMSQGIPGISAPVPALPGFTKKKKPQGTAEQNSHHSAPVTTRSSPQPIERHAKVSTSSSLPSRPASLPLKPLTIVPPLLIHDHDVLQDNQSPAAARTNKDSQSPLSMTLHPASIESTERDALQQSQRSKSSRAASPLAAEILPSILATEADDALRLALDGKRTVSVSRAASKDDVTMQDDNGGAALSKSAASSSTSTHAPVARKAIAQSAAAHLLTSPNSSVRHQPHPSPRLVAGKLPSRPGTPQGRKNLPASVVSASLGRSISDIEMGVNAKSSSVASSSGNIHADRAGSLQAISADISSASTTTHSAQPQIRHSKSAAGLGQKGIFASIQSTATSAAADQEAKAAKAKRKEEKRKRKLAAAAATNGESSMSGIKMSRDNSLVGGPPNKIRRTDSPAPNQLEQAQVPQAGLKVRLNGVMLNSKNLLSGLGIDNTTTKKVVQIPGVAEDFSLPKHTAVPAPPELKVPEATPMLQSEVDADFDQAKPATQVPYSTYANWMNDFLRPFGEDDLAYLSTRKDDSSYYIVPHLGSHYQEQWAAADADTSIDNIEMPAANMSLRPPAPKRFRADQLSSEVLNTENVYLGPLGERVMSAFRPLNGYSRMLNEIRLHSHAQAASGQPGDSKRMATTAAESCPQFQDLDSFLAQPQVTRSEPDADAVDFETRLTQELAFLGIIPLPTVRESTAVTVVAGSKTATSSNGIDIPQSVDWATREDDEISHALRACQRLLREQTNLNKARKERLAERVRGRIAYQEYETLRDGLEAVIEGAWHKRQRAAQRRAHKEKKDKDKKDKDRDREAEATATLAQQIAALNQPQPLSASLVTALTKRRNLVDGISSLFPKDAYVLPAESVYADIKPPAAYNY